MLSRSRPAEGDGTGVLKGMAYGRLNFQPSSAEPFRPWSFRMILTGRGSCFLNYTRLARIYLFPACSRSSTRYWRPYLELLN